MEMKWWDDVLFECQEKKIQIIFMLFSFSRFIFIFTFLGRGVFTHKAIEASMFVVEYRGNIFSHKDRTPKKKCGDTLNNYLFEFLWKGAQWW